MSDSHVNSLLNDLLIELHCSLVRYIGEAWPWSEKEDEELREMVQRIGERQEAGVARLVQILQQRSHDIDFGTYPQDYTSLHYVALEFLCSAMKTSQQNLSEWIWSLLPQLQNDPQAEQVVREIAESQRLTTQELNALKLPEHPQAVAWMK